VEWAIRPFWRPTCPPIGYTKDSSSPSESFCSLGSINYNISGPRCQKSPKNVGIKGFFRLARQLHTSTQRFGIGLQRTLACGFILPVSSGGSSVTAGAVFFGTISQPAKSTLAKINIINGTECRDRTEQATHHAQATRHAVCFHHSNCPASKQADNDEAQHRLRAGIVLRCLAPICCLCLWVHKSSDALYSGFFTGQASPWRIWGVSRQSSQCWPRLER